MLLGKEMGLLEVTLGEQKETGILHFLCYLGQPMGEN